MRVVVYDILTDYTDEYLRIREDTMLKCIQLFVKVLIRIFIPMYL
jgi:hypothetical protein